MFYGTRELSPEEKRKTKKVILCIFLILVALAVANCIKDEKDAEPSPTPMTEPRSGKILSGLEIYDGSEITVTASNSASCVVRLKTSSGITRLSFYVRAGDTVTVGVPSEYLYVYFASGKTWYGKEHLFGERTSYSMDDDILDFTQYSWEYELRPMADGNFSQTPVNEDEFKT